MKNYGINCKNINSIPELTRTGITETPAQLTAGVDKGEPAVILNVYISKHEDIQLYLSPKETIELIETLQSRLQRVI